MIQQAFEDQIVSCKQVFQWHSWFKTGRTSVDDDEHTERTTSCTTPDTVAQIQELISQDRRQTIHDIPEEVGIGYGTCQWVLTKELSMHRVTEKFVLRNLTVYQKQQCIEVRTKLHQLTFDGENSLSRVITGDNSWAYCYDPETKQQSSPWKILTDHRGEKQCQ
jgi:hypothetical protein